MTFLDVIIVYGCMMLLIGAMAFYFVHLGYQAEGRREDAFKWSDEDWQRTFEPNRVNVAEYPSREDILETIDHEYLRDLRLSQSSLILPDDHLPHEWQAWGDKRGRHDRPPRTV